jgi:hypothetical protein
MSKVYAVAGVSKHKGKIAVRYANSASRAGVLARNGHTNVNLYVFEEAVSKEDCVDLLLHFDRYEFSAAEQKAIKEEARSLGFIV